ncbi:uncharacterized protein FIBRA_02311 [Fibroporia radiculosa]|uniref:Uncharacterized protein n=1 Tax=Fibroporia radiculosa TaxID=599839 RepID=J4I8Z7_9APHY|nr:uncharacterized protein FIBRA_02311 [Fibroporia radiculosa]CCM00281.1 predicted protein [Fibroporia radiculosa]
MSHSVIEDLLALQAAEIVRLRAQLEAERAEHQHGRQCASLRDLERLREELGVQRTATIPSTDGGDAALERLEESKALVNSLRADLDAAQCTIVEFKEDIDQAKLNLQAATMREKELEEENAGVYTMLSEEKERNSQCCAGLLAEKAIVEARLEESEMRTGALLDQISREQDTISRLSGDTNILERRVDELQTSNETVCAQLVAEQEQCRRYRQALETTTRHAEEAKALFSKMCMGTALLNGSSTISAEIIRSGSTSGQAVNAENMAPNTVNSSPAGSVEVALNGSMQGTENDTEGLGQSEAARHVSNNQESLDTYVIVTNAELLEPSAEPESMDAHATASSIQDATVVTLDTQAQPNHEDPYKPEMACQRIEDIFGSFALRGLTHAQLLQAV